MKFKIDPITGQVIKNPSDQSNPTKEKWNPADYINTDEDFPKEDPYKKLREKLSTSYDLASLKKSLPMDDLSSASKLSTSELEQSGLNMDMDQERALDQVMDKPEDFESLKDYFKRQNLQKLGKNG